MSSDEGKSPLDIINEARRGVASADEEPAGSSSHDARDGASYPGIARTREEHIKRATGSFTAVDAERKRSRTNNPRELKALKEKQQAEAQAREQAARRDELAASVASAAASDAGTSTTASGQGAPSAGAQSRNPRGRRPRVERAIASEKDPKAADLSSGVGAPTPDAGTDSVRPSVSSRTRRRSAKADGGARTVPLAGDGGDAASAEKNSKTSAEGASRRTGLVVRVVAAVLAALLVVSVGGFSWYRWLAGDDALDIQGTWYIAGTDTPIVITEEQIVLNEEVSYGYVLDESAKTIDFTFSYLEGAGHYRFSLDRQMLAIMDGKFGWWDTLGDDLAWLPGALVDALGGATASPAGSGGVTLLSRDPPSAQTPDAPASPSGEIADAATADPNAADAEGASDASEGAGSADAQTAG